MPSVVCGCQLCFCKLLQIFRIPRKSSQPPSPFQHLLPASPTRRFVLTSHFLRHSPSQPQLDGQLTPLRPPRGSSVASRPLLAGPGHWSLLLKLGVSVSLTTTASWPQRRRQFGQRPPVQDDSKSAHRVRPSEFSPHGFALSRRTTGSNQIASIYPTHSEL